MIYLNRKVYFWFVSPNIFIINSNKFLFYIQTDRRRRDFVIYKHIVKTRSEYGSCPCCVIPQGRQYGSKRADAGCQNDLSRHIIWTISKPVLSLTSSYQLVFVVAINILWALVLGSLPNFLGYNVMHTLYGRVIICTYCIITFNKCNNIVIPVTKVTTCL